MKKITNIKIISIDLFRTIVDIEPTPEMIWQMFLKGNSTDEKSGKLYQRANEIMDRRWEAAGIDDTNFKNVRTVLEETVSELFNEINLDHDPAAAADALMGDHSLKNIFRDAKPFLEKAGQKYPICLSTDCDVEMIENVDEIYQFDKLFVSEQMHVYKLNPRFFKQVINYYNVPADRILHIGDSKSDIVVPKQLGIRTCWLNRRNLRWDDLVKPDFEATSLLEILDILD